MGDLESFSVKGGEKWAQPGGRCGVRDCFLSWEIMQQICLMMEIMQERVIKYFHFFRQEGLKSMSRRRE